MCETPREKEVKRRWFTAARCNSRRMRTKTDRAGAQQRKAAEVKKLPRIIFAKKKIIFACPGKIEGWGMCNKACSPQNQAFAFANMNLLTDDECRALTKWVGDRGDQKIISFTWPCVAYQSATATCSVFTQSNIKVHHFGYSGPFWATLDQLDHSGQFWDHWIPSRPFGQFWPAVPQIFFDACLIFFISFTQAGFLNPKLLYPETLKNTQK